MFTVAIGEQASNERGPSGLMAGPEALAGVAVEVLVKQEKIAPVGVLRETRVCPVANPAALVVRAKDPPQPGSQFTSRFLQIYPPARAGWTFNAQSIAVEMVVTLQGFHQQVIYREPDWAAPVGIAAK